MKIADGIEALELNMDFMGRQMVIHPTLIWNNDTVILVDTGMPGQLPQIRKAMDEIGVPLSKLGEVILTHQDIDHIGGLSDILKASGRKIEILAHEADRPYIEGAKPLIKMSSDRVAKMLEALPEERRKHAEAMFTQPPKASVDRTIADGETLPWCGEITVIFTPGHTPGHVSLYVNKSKTLIAGDAMVVADGQLLGPNPQATLDMETATKSLKQFTQYDIETVLCYHGGIYSDNANQRLEELARGQ